MPLPLLLTSALALAQIDPAEIDPARIDPAQLDSLDVQLPERVLFDATAEGAHWALGHSYKACVDGNGLQFVPYLGPDAPTTSATFAVRSVTAGGEPVPLEPSAVRRDGTSLVVDRGPLVERYACSLDSVEQFVEIDLDGLSGSVRIEFSVETDLARPARAQAPFRFGDPTAAIDVGEAFVLPGDGTKLPVESVRTPEGYAIVVPESVVDAAGDRLVIDPVINSGALFSNPPHPFVIADVAYLGSSGFYLVVERAFSSTDSDVILYRLPGLTGGTLTFIAIIDVTSTNWEDPALAAIERTDELMVIATRGAGTGRRVHARSSSPDGLSVGVPFLVSSPNVEAFDPDIGAESGGPFLGRRFMAVWSNRFFDLRGVYVRPLDGNGPAGNARQIDTVQVRSSIPAISTGSGEPGTFDPQRFRIAYKQTSNTGQESIWAVDVDRNASVVTPGWRVASVASTQRVSVCSSNASRLPDGSAPYVIVWDSGLSITGDIYAATCVDGSVRGSIANLSAMSDDRRSNEQRRPTVAAGTDRFLVTYQDRPFQGDWQVYMCSGQPAPETFGLAERNQVLLESGTPQTNATVASRFEGGVDGSSGNTCYSAWVNESGATTLEGGYLRGVSASGAAGVQYCTAAPNSTGKRAWIYANGDGGIASNHDLFCSDMPTGSPCFILTAREPGFVVNVGGSAGNLCLGGLGFGRFSNQVRPTDAQGLYILSLDPQNIAQPAGTVPASVGETWYFQAWFRDGSPAGPTSNLSNAIAVEFVM